MILVAVLEGSIAEGQVRIGAQVFGEHGRWKSDSFPLLDVMGSTGTLSRQLSREYTRVRDAVEAS
jgi:hypothetical protein